MRRFMVERGVAVERASASAAAEEVGGSEDNVDSDDEQIVFVGRNRDSRGGGRKAAPGGDVGQVMLLDLPCDDESAAFKYVFPTASSSFLDWIVAGYLHLVAGAGLRTPFPVTTVSNPPRCRLGARQGGSCISASSTFGAACLPDWSSRDRSGNCFELPLLTFCTHLGTVDKRKDRSSVFVIPSCYANKTLIDPSAELQLIHCPALNSSATGDLYDWDLSYHGPMVLVHVALLIKPLLWIFIRKRPNFPSVVNGRLGQNSASSRPSCSAATLSHRVAV